MQYHAYVESSLNIENIQNKNLYFLKTVLYHQEKEIITKLYIYIQSLMNINDESLKIPV